MSLIISPASAPRSSPVTLTNTLGRPITFRVTLGTCKGHTTYTSGPLQLANGGRYTVPQGGPGDPHHRVVTFSVAQPGGTVAATASISSNQGCTAAGYAKARTSARTAPLTHTGHLQVTPAAHTSGIRLDAIAAVLLVLAVLVAAPFIIYRRRHARLVALARGTSHRKTVSGRR